MCEARTEQRADPARYNHSLLMTKRPSSLLGISCCSLTPVLLLTSQQASNARVLGNLGLADQISLQLPLPPGLRQC